MKNDINNISLWISDYFAKAGRTNAVVGISGGIDSAVTAALCVQALGNDRVLGAILPIESNKNDFDDAMELIEQLQIGHVIVDQGTEFENWYNNLINSDEVSFYKDANVFAVDDQMIRANAKARFRMTTLYALSEMAHGLVVGTTNKSEALIGYACYDEKTRVLTKDGFKDYKTLKNGDVVFSLNPGTGRIEEKPIKGIFISDDFDGELYHIKSKMLDLKITKDHKLVISKNHGKGPIVLTEAYNRCESKGTTSIPRPKPWIGKTSYDLIKTEDFLTDKPKPNENESPGMELNDFLYLMGLHIGNGCINKSKIKYNGSGLSVKERIKIRDKNGRFIRTNKNITTIYENDRVCIASVENKRSRKPLITLLNKYCIPHTDTKTFVSFSCKGISEAFKECGHTAKNKTIPKWVLELSDNRLEYLFKGLMDSDGNADGSGYNTSSESLVHKFIELCYKIGKTANITRRPPKTSVLKDGKEIKSSGCYYLGISSKQPNWGFNNKNVKIIKHKGTIWCPSVPPHGNLIVERNGKITICGNTKFGDGGVDIEPLMEYYKTEVFELAKELDIPQSILDKKPSAGLWPGQTDEDEIGMPYSMLDNILKYLDPKNSESISFTSFGGNIEKVKRMIRANSHKLNTPPHYERKT